MLEDEASFQAFLSQIASRLRHDLMGGLITLKMGLESLPDEESLKSPLLEKAQELVELSDKIVLLLRMGRLSLQTVRPESLFGQAAKQAESLYPELKIEVRAAGDLGRWTVDPDALTYAVLELCQNATLAQGSEVTLEVSREGDRGVARVIDNGVGLADAGVEERIELKEVGVSRWGRGGLGLAVVERCARAHHGKFTLEPGNGGTEARLEVTLGRVES